MSDRIKIYTDGGCRPNPGPGGWGVVLLRPGKEPLELSGGVPDATNNRMELTAAIEALRAAGRGEEVEVFTDSEYLRQGVTTWLDGWRRRGWRTAAGKDVQNRDLWQQLETEIERHDIRWRWVRGHSGNKWNERADELASSALPREVGLVCDPDAVHIVLSVAFSGKMNRGSWAALLRFKDSEKELSGVCDGTTANRMHIDGAAAALEALKRPVRGHVYTSSDYLKDGATTWLAGWRSRGWVTRDGRPVSNRDSWQRLERQLGRHRLIWHVFKRDDDVDEFSRVKDAARAALASDQGMT